MNVAKFSDLSSAVSCEKRNALRLRPKIHPLVDRYLNAREEIFKLGTALGSPLNLLFPQLIGENLRAFQSCLQTHRLRGRIFFAHKANGSHCLPRQLATEDACIDVSSANELRHALGCGFASPRIQATGPKSVEFLSLCVLHGITISIDSVWELAELLSIRKRLAVKDPTPILLRVSGFKSPHSHFRAKASRFGVPLGEIESAFDLLQEHQSQWALLGFAFHLDTVSVPEKALAVENCLALFEEAFGRGFEPTVLNVGGGFKVNYLAHADDWNSYTTAMREAVLGSREAITWQGNSFGLMADKGSLRGSFNTYSYYDTLTGARFLDELLSYRFGHLDDADVASLIRDNGIELWIEPGRALLDQTGITVARVNSLRRSSNGELMVCLNMKRQDVCFLDQEIFVDPIVLQQRSKPSAPDAVPVYFAGHLCLESDLIYRHQVFLPVLPEPGDLVAIINTAGYFMDFSASHAIMHDIAQKVAVFHSGGEFRWVADDHYHPWILTEEN